MKIGQIVYLEEYDYRGNREDSLKECEITKVGKKYFEVSNHRCRFFIDSLKHDNGQYTSRRKIHLSSEDFYINIEIENKTKILRNYFNGSGKINLTLDQINSILRIIDIAQTNEPIR